MISGNGHDASWARASGSSRYMNVVLTAIALLLGVVALKHSAIGPDIAHAAPHSVRTNAAPSDVAAGMPNAAEQRIRILNAITAVDARLMRIEGALTNGPISVRVVELPPEPETTE